MWYSGHSQPTLHSPWPEHISSQLTSPSLRFSVATKRHQLAWRRNAPKLPRHGKDSTPTDPIRVNKFYRKNSRANVENFGEIFFAPIRADETASKSLLVFERSGDFWDSCGTRPEIHPLKYINSSILLIRNRHRRATHDIKRVNLHKGQWAIVPQPITSQSHRVFVDT